MNQPQPCLCTCHLNKLDGAYQHDKLCCDNINGEVVSQPQQQENWEIEFDKRWEYKGGFQNTPIFSDIKDFIRTQREKARREGIESAIEAIPWDYRYTDGKVNRKKSNDRKELKQSLRDKLLR